MTRETPERPDQEQEPRGNSRKPRKPYTAPQIIYREQLEVVASACSAVSAKSLGAPGPCVFSTSS